ncbi:MAG: hypothetical protein ABIJ28_01725 [Patescibacteria group bacterium]
MISQVQTERMTILVAPDFKAWLTNEAKKEEVSLSELVRQRCKQTPNQDEILLSLLIDEVKESTKKAKDSLNKGLEDAEQILSELRSKKQ